MKFGVQAVGLRKRIGKAEVLRSISFALEEGNVGAFVGPSGAGKSTLLNALSGLVPLDSGKIFIDGNLVESVGDPDEKPVYVSPVDRNIGYVFQDYLLFPHMTVYENVAFGLKARKLARAEVQERVHRVLAMIGLDELADRRPNQLSGGQSQRVALARALVLQPKVLFFDEPLSALDRATRESLRVELRRIFDETGMTVVYVTHDLDEAYFFGHKIGLLQKGELSFFGTKAELLDTMSESTAEFLGFNVLRGKVLATEGPDTLLSSKDWGDDLRIPLVNASEKFIGQEVAIAVPPGSIRVSPRSAGEAGPVAMIQEVWEFKDRAQVVLRGVAGGRLIGEFSNLEFQERPLTRGDSVEFEVGSGLIMVPQGK